MYAYENIFLEEKNYESEVSSKRHKLRPFSDERRLLEWTDKNVGVATIKWLNGETYTGDTIKNGLRDGSGTHRWSRNRVYVGDFKLDKRDGIGKMTTMDHKQGIYEGEWHSDQRHGFGSMNLKSGTHYEG